MTDRLTSEDWLRAGFRKLATAGPQALKAEVLARDLGTTKGSFYWHFKDVPAFRSAMLSLWRDRAVTDIISGLDTIPDPRDRLRALGEIVANPAPDSFGGARAEAAIRVWGFADQDVAKAVVEVDAERTAYLRDLLTQCGCDPETATLLYATYVGFDQLMALNDQTPAGLVSEVIELLLKD